MCISDYKFALVVALGLSVASCDAYDSGTYLYGEDGNSVEFAVHSTEMGIFPSPAVLSDPNNIFAEVGVGNETKWEILTEAPNPVGFYAWATILAFQPTGEHQYYTATKLQAIYENQETANEYLLDTRDMAIAAYQSVLDNFPDSVTFDPSGTVAFPLRPLAFNGIVALGGTPLGGWVQVSTPSGGTTVVQVADPPPPAEEEEL